jgi:hypothetical protein
MDSEILIALCLKFMYGSQQSHASPDQGIFDHMTNPHDRVVGIFDISKGWYTFCPTNTASVTIKAAQDKCPITNT